MGSSGVEQGRGSVMNRLCRYFVPHANSEGESDGGRGIIIIIMMGGAVVLHFRHSRRWVVDWSEEHHPGTEQNTEQETGVTVCVDGEKQNMGIINHNYKFKF